MQEQKQHWATNYYIDLEHMPFVEVISSMVKMNSRKTLAVTDFDLTWQEKA